MSKKKIGKTQDTTHISNSDRILSWNDQFNLYICVHFSGLKYVEIHLKRVFFNLHAYLDN